MDEGYPSLTRMFSKKLQQPGRQKKSGHQAGLSRVTVGMLI
jgi:hypothetical protein